MTTYTDRMAQQRRNPVQPRRSTLRTSLVCLLAILAGLSQFVFYMHVAGWHGVAMAILCPLAGVLFVLWFRDVRRHYEADGIAWAARFIRGRREAA